MPPIRVQDPICYVCPYCTKGRFTASEGWDMAVRHIRENHNRGGTSRARRRRNHPPRQFEFDLFDMADDSLLAQEAFS